MDHFDTSADRSYVSFERTAKGVITPRVKVVMGDDDERKLMEILARAKTIFSDALAYAEDVGSQP